MRTWGKRVAGCAGGCGSGRGLHRPVARGGARRRRPSRDAGRARRCPPRGRPGGARPPSAPRWPRPGLARGRGARSRSWPSPATRSRPPRWSGNAGPRRWRSSARSSGPPRARPRRDPRHRLLRDPDVAPHARPRASGPRPCRPPGEPPAVLRLVELVPAPATDPATVERAAALLCAAGFAPVRLGREVEGFVLNRLQGALLREAYRLVDEGVTDVAGVEAAVRMGLGPRWALSGPFETAELNTPGGIRAHAARMGPAYAAMGAARGETVDWSRELVDRVEARTPRDSPPRRLPGRAPGGPRPWPGLWPCATVCMRDRPMSGPLYLRRPDVPLRHGAVARRRADRRRPADAAQHRLGRAARPVLRHGRLPGLPRRPSTATQPARLHDQGCAGGSTVRTQIALPAARPPPRRRPRPPPGASHARRAGDRRRRGRSLGGDRGAPGRRRVMVLDERSGAGRPVLQAAGGTGAPADAPASRGRGADREARASGVDDPVAASRSGAPSRPAICADREGAALSPGPSARSSPPAPMSGRMVPGWTLPGVMTTGAAQTLWRSYASLPGRRVLLAGNGPLNLQVAPELARRRRAGLWLWRRRRRAGGAPAGRRWRMALARPR